MDFKKSRDSGWLIKQSTMWGLLSCLLITLGFSQLDQTIAYFFKQPELEKYYSFNREITNIGYSIHYFAIAILGLIISRFFSKKINRLKDNFALTKAIEQWSLFVIKCLIYCGIIIEIIKFIVGRQRAHITTDFQNLVFDPFNFHWHWHSFPSGHSQVVFTVATIAFLIWPKYKYLYFILACYLAFTRVVIHQHFFSDFVAGAYLGYILPLWINYYWPPKLTEIQNK